MQITDVRVRKATGNEGKLKAFCSVVIDGAFVVHDLRIVEGAHGLFVAMPRQKNTKGEFKDMAHPITAEAREHLQQSVLTAFEAAEKKEQTEKTDETALL
ncbi:MAG TPA: septation regulator SpoVG [Symbiobacteriaceae bacterium]|nr:septation regulator SpoVG [Symbiobacteriaceae bacterium]